MLSDMRDFLKGNLQELYDISIKYILATIKIIEVENRIFLVAGKWSRFIIKAVSFLKSCNIKLF